MACVIAVEKAVRGLCRISISERADREIERASERARSSIPRREESRVKKKIKGLLLSCRSHYEIPLAIQYIWSGPLYVCTSHSFTVVQGICNCSIFISSRGLSPRRRTLQDLIAHSSVSNSDLQNLYHKFRRSSVVTFFRFVGIFAAVHIRR